MSLMFNALVVGAEENDYSIEITVTHNTMYNLEDNLCKVWGSIYIQNNGDVSAYIDTVDYLIQSEHSRWVTMKSENLFSAGSKEGAIELASGEKKTFTYMTTFSPEEGNDSYRHRVIVEVYNSDSDTSKFFSDNFITLADGNYLPPTTSPPTTSPPVVVNTYEYTPGDTQPPTTPPNSQDTTSFEEIDDGMKIKDVKGTITNIFTDITNGGYAVCVEINVTKGSIDESSLYLSITSNSEEGWGKVFEDSMNIEVAGGLDTENTPLTFCFEGIYLTGDVEDYEACVAWKQGYVGDDGPIISRMCVDFHQVPAIDIITYGVILGTIALIASVAVYLRKGK